jgi:hypothetical protein
MPNKPNFEENDHTKEKCLADPISYSSASTVSNGKKCHITTIAKLTASLPNPTTIS